MGSHKLQRFARRYRPGALLLGLLILTGLSSHLSAWIICVIAVLLGVQIYNFLRKRTLRQGTQ